MQLEFFIALRHLMSRERRALISIITGISVLGVVVGVAALVAVIAVMDGADSDYIKQLIDVYAHLEVYEMDATGMYPGLMTNYEEVMRVIAEDPAVVASAPILKRSGAIRLDSSGGAGAESVFPAQIWGVDPDLEAQVSRIGQDNGRVIGKRIPDDGEIVLGNLLAQSMRVTIGDEVFVLSGLVSTTATGPIAKQSRLRVVGLFEAGIYEIDKSVSYVSLATSQRMNMIGDSVDFVHVRLRDAFRVDAPRDRIMERLNQALPGRYQGRTWAELNPDFFAALTLEKIGMFIILLLVVIVASLNIISTLILVTMEKTREIGVLRAIGTSRRSIRRIFLYEGALIGIVGTLIGVVVGLILCYFLKYHFPIELPEAVYGLQGLPVKVVPQTVMIIMVCSIGISLAASVLPAVLAARLNIVEALRYE